MECIDTFGDLDLLQDEDGYTVQHADDPSLGASLLFAYHEQMMEGNHNNEYHFDAAEIAQIDDWFNEHEA